MENSKKENKSPEYKDIYVKTQYQQAGMELSSKEAKNNLQTPYTNPLLAVMTVELGQGQTDKIFINLNDDPYALAVRFSEKHGFNPDVVTILVENIKTNKKLAQDDLEKKKQLHREAMAEAQGNWPTSVTNMNTNHSSLHTFSNTNKTTTQTVSTQGDDTDRQ